MMDKTTLSVFCFLFIVLGLVIHLAAQEEKEWESFSSVHNCKVVAKISGELYTTVGIGVKGQMAVGTGSIPSKTSYLCDDGITYTR